MDQLKRHNMKIISREEDKSTGWALIDTGYIIIHLFSEESRKIYNLEEVWKKGIEVSIPEKLYYEGNAEIKEILEKGHEEKDLDVDKY